MSTDLAFALQITGTGPKGTLSPVDVAYLLNGQRGALVLDFVVDTADAARAIALPAEGATQSQFIICANYEFTFTINAGAVTYTLKPGLPNGGDPMGLFVLGPTPLVNSIEVTGGAVNSTAWLMRVMET